MPGAEILIERYWKSAVGASAGRTPPRAPRSERPARNPMTDHASGLREACEGLTADLRVYVDERMVTA